MFIKVESTVKEKIADIEKRYPNSVYIARMDDIKDDSCYLLAVSTDRDSYVEFCEYIKSIGCITPVCKLGGQYADEEDTMYVCSSLDKRRFVINSVFDDSISKYDVPLIFDPGAEGTCLSLAMSTLFIHCKATSKPIRLTGMVKSGVSYVYGVRIPIISLGNVLLFNKEVFLTNDANVTSCVMGMDLLEDLSFYYDGVVKSLVIDYPRFGKVPVNSQQVAADKVLHEMNVLTTETSKLVYNLIPKVDMTYENLVECTHLALHSAGLLQS